MRLPQTLTAHPLSQALFQLLAVTWERRYPRVYACAEALYTMVRQPGFLDANIAPVLTTMITEFVGTQAFSGMVIA
jgi:COP9 signalosome complex subunit 8